MLVKAYVDANEGEIDALVIGLFGEFLLEGIINITVIVFYGEDFLRCL